MKLNTVSLLLALGSSLAAADFVPAPAEQLAVTGKTVKLADGKLPADGGPWIWWSQGGTALTPLAGIPAFRLDALVPGSLKVKKAGVPLVEGEDYRVDYHWGRIGAGAMAKAGDALEVEFKCHLERLDSVARGADGKEICLKGESAPVSPAFPRLPAGSVRVASFLVDGSGAKRFPVLEDAAAAKTDTTAGMIPKTMAKIKAGQPVKIVCWGDSVTFGSDVNHDDAYTQVFERLLKAKFPQADLQVKVVARGSSNSSNWLHPDKSPYLGKPELADSCRWEDVVQAKPDLITLEFVNDAGLNAAQVAKNYGEILERAQKLGAELLLITPHFTNPQLYAKPPVDQNLRPYVLALKAFTKEHKLALADASSRWAHLENEGVPFMVYLKNANNHPDARGHRLFAEELLKNFE